MELFREKRNEEAAREAASHIRDGSYLRGAFVVAAYMDVRSVLDVFASGVLHPVSEIPGRSNFNDTMLHVLKKRETCEDAGVSMFDVTGFKKINDTLGFKNGDRTLLTVAKSFYDNQQVDTKQRFVTDFTSGLQLAAASRRKTDRNRSDAWHLAGDEYALMMRGVESKSDLDDRTTALITQVLKGEVLQALITDMLEAPMMEKGNFDPSRRLRLGLRAGTVLLSDVYDRGTNQYERLDHLTEMWDPKTHKVVQIEGEYSVNGLEGLEQTYPAVALET